jgi:hypothetical protein
VDYEWNGNRRCCYYSTYRLGSIQSIQSANARRRGQKLTVHLNLLIPLRALFPILRCEIPCSDDLPIPISSLAHTPPSFP